MQNQGKKVPQLQKVQQVKIIDAEERNSKLNIFD